MVRRTRSRGPSVAALGHQPVLDGLRGFALFIILLYHARFDWALGGFLSLTTFFTLSGFLITSLMLREWARTGDLDKRRFWSRRFRRLLPASWFTLILVMAAGAFGLWDNSQMRSLRTDVPSALFEVFNWHLILGGRSYGDQFVAPSPIEHFWSLAVEQQFYLLLPVVVTGLLALGDRRRGTLRIRPLVIAFAAMTVASAAVCWWFARDDMNRAYLGTDTRMAELLVGGLLACIMLRVIRLRSRAARIAFDLLGLAAVVVSLWVFHQATLSTEWVYPWGMLIVAAATALMIVGALQGGFLGHALSWAPLVWFGGISYGVYLLHWPVFLILGPERIGWPPVPLFALRFAVTVVLAWAMFKLLEHPIRSGQLLSTRTIAVALPVSMVAVLASALVVTRDLPAPTTLESAASHGAPTAAVRPLQVTMLGDELAASAQTGMSTSGGRTPMNVTVDAAPGCGFALGGWVRTSDGQAERDIDRCATVRDRWVAKVTAERPDVVVLWGGIRDVADRRLSMTDSWDGPSGARNADFLRADTGDLIDRLSATGASVVVLSVPHFRNAQPSAPAPTTTLPSEPIEKTLTAQAILRFREGVPPAGFAENDDARIDQWNALLMGVANQHGATFIDAASDMRAWPGGEFDAERRAAGLGLSASGVESLGSWLAPKLRNLNPVTPPAVSSAIGLSATAPLPVAPPAKPRRLVPADGTATITVGGDSVAYGLGYGVNRWATSSGEPADIVNAGRFGCPVTRGGSYRYLQDIADFDPTCDWSQNFPQMMADQNPNVVVLSSGIWEIVDRRFAGDDRWRHVGQPDVDNYILSEYLSAIDVLGSRGATVVLVTQPHIEAGTAQGYTDLPESDPARIDRLNALLVQAAGLRPGVAQVIDLQGWVASQPGGELDPAKRVDGVHFTDDYSAVIGAWLGPQLLSIARGPASP